MASIINKVLFIAIAIIALTEFGSALKIVISPRQSNKDTKQVTIKCTVDVPVLSTKKVLTIGISKQIKDIPIISIRSDQHLAKGSYFKKNMKAEGFIYKDGGRNFLSLTIINPTVQGGGSYKCQMFYSNEDNQILNEHVMDTFKFQNVDPTHCPDGWTLYEGDQTCLKAFGLQDDSATRSWSQARDACQEIGADLAVIQDRKKNAFVLKMSINGWYGPWLGIKNYSTGKFDFRYVDGSPINTYHPWIGGKPYHDGVEKVECVYMFTGKYNPGQWGILECVNKQPYVCSTQSFPGEGA